MLHTLKGSRFDCLFALVSIKMELPIPQPLHVCTNVCIIYAHTKAGLIRGLNSVPVLVITRGESNSTRFHNFAVHAVHVITVSLF